MADFVKFILHKAHYGWLLTCPQAGDQTYLLFGQGGAWKRSLPSQRQIRRIVS